MSIAKILKDARLKIGDSIDKVSLRIQISNAYLSELESGKSLRPKLAILNSLADYYGLDKDDLTIRSGKIPQDVYYKIVNNPDLLEVIRNYKT